MTPLDFTRECVETRITSLSDSELAVTLVGHLIIWTRFSSLQVLHNAQLSRPALNKLQFKSPSTKIGFPKSNASVYVSLNEVSKQFNGQSEGLYHMLCKWQMISASCTAKSYLGESYPQKYYVERFFNLWHLMPSRTYKYAHTPPPALWRQSNRNTLKPSSSTSAL